MRQLVRSMRVPLWVVRAMSGAALAFAVSGAVAAPVIDREVFHQPSRGRVGEPMLFFASGLASPVKVFFASASGTVEATPVVVDLTRGIVAVRVPAGAISGNMKVRANGVDSASWYFRVEAGSFTQGTDAVSGKVKVAAGTGVPNAFVGLFRDTSCDNQSLQDYAQTDSNGHYAMHGVDGHYLLLAFPPVSSGKGPAGGEATLGTSPASADIVVGPGTLVTGKVVAAGSSTGIAGARVSCDLRDDGFGHEEVVTDATGSFSARLSAGNWRFDVAPPAGDTTHAYAETEASIAGTSQNLGNIGLSGGVLISGTATRAADGSPLAGIEISAAITEPCCTDIDRKMSAGDGGYALIVPANGTYSLRASFDDQSSFVDLYAYGIAVATSPVDHDFTALDAATISGTVLDASTSGGIVELGVRAFDSLGMDVDQTRTCADGTYRLRLAPSAQGYRVSTGLPEDSSSSPAYAYQTWNNTAAGTYYPCEGTLIPLASSGAAATGVNFSLPAGATIEGTVASEAQKCSNDFGNGYVVVDDGTDHECSLGQPDTMQPAGGYRIVGLPASATVASLRACVGIPGYDPQCWNQQVPPSYTPLVIAGGGTQSDVDLCLASCTQHTWYMDFDHDGHGNPNGSVGSCSQPENTVDVAGDCNDSNSAIHPGAIELCNNTDDDCDGTTDEGNPGGGEGCTTGQPGACSAGTRTCQNGSLQCVPNASPSTETCDNLDNDCDGSVDEGNPGGGAGCVTGQPGVCAAGSQVCANGIYQCVSFVSPSAETCDNLDNNCDGTTDGFGTSCGVGACASAGTCAAGVNSCVPGSPTAEVCDGADNNCNGQTDEGNPGGGTACATGQPGVCWVGTAICQSGSVQCVHNVAPSQESCDNQDNDCDGTVDGFVTGCGVGACAATGTCTAGIDSCSPGSSSAETCDGADNDCDGSVDEGNPGGGGACATGLHGVCEPGTQTCQGGSFHCVQNVQPSSETCDGLDNDCDSTIDDGNPGGGAGCGTGQLGVCAAGTMTCQSGAVSCLRNTAPSAESCDGADNDCDGTIDDGNPGGGIACATGQLGVCAAGTTACASGSVGCVRNIAPSAETCDNLDNNCDGSVDGFATSCGTGICANTGVCTAGVDSCTAGTPKTEVCDGVDDDCDGTIDEVAGGCSLYVTDPLGAEVLDCHAGSPPPVLTWHNAQYDKFRVFISTNPTFATQKINSGKKYLTATSYAFSAGKWASICSKATTALYVKVLGVDVNVPSSNPLRKLYSPTVPVTVVK